MALVVADRVQETTNTTGTGTLTLAGAVSGFRSFSVIGNANTTYYTIVSGTNWEVGLGTYTSSGTTLSRDTVLASSAGGTTKISVAAGATVFCTYPADKAVYLAANGFLGLGIEPDGSSRLQIAAGTNTTAPLELTTSAGTVMTTPDDGSIEYDGEVFYGTPIANSRGVMITEHFVARTGTKTLANSTALQSIFSGGTGGLTNGALTVAGSCSYYFECMISVTSMSSTSGNMGFSLVGAGTATFTSAAWVSTGSDNTTTTTPATMTGVFNAAAGLTTNIFTAVNNTSAYGFIRGIFRVNAAGTIIPSIQLTNAAAAVIGANTYFRCYPIGTDTAISVGNWS